MLYEETTFSREARFASFPKKNYSPLAAPIQGGTLFESVQVKRIRSKGRSDQLATTCDAYTKTYLVYDYDAYTKTYMIHNLR